MEPIGPSYRPPRLPGEGWVLVAAGGFRLVTGERYTLAVRAPASGSSARAFPRWFRGGVRM
jgi:hypothetical protein